MADGSLLFNTKMDTSGFSKGMSIVTKALGGLTFAALAKEVIELGSSFETSFAKASTLFGDVSVDTDNLNKKIKEMSESTGVAGTELNETLYQAMSAGIPVTEDMSEALDAVNTAAKLSKGGFTSSATAMSALTTAINAYKLPASDAIKIADELITVQNKGVTTVDELASNMGKGISTASAYNVNLENLNAGYIALTKSGISTAESTTYLAGMFNELGDSGSDVSAVLQEETGMTFGQMMESGYTLADVMDILTESVDGNAEALMNLWGSQEAGKAANAIVQQGTDNFRKSLDDLENSTGATEDAYNTMMDTFEGKTSRLKESANNFRISIFEKILPALNAAIDGLTWLSEHIEYVIPVVAALAAMYLYMNSTQIILNASTLLMKLSLMDLSTTMLACPFFWIVAAITAVVIAFIYLWNNCEEFRNFWIDLWEKIKDIFSTVCDAIVGFFTETIPQAIETVKEFFQGLTDAIVGFFTETIPGAIETVKEFFQGLVDKSNSVVDAISKFFSELPGRIWEWLTGIVANVAEWGAQLYEGACQAVSNAIDAIVQFFTDLPYKIGYALGFVIGKLISFGIEAVNWVITTVPQIIESIVTFFSELPGKIWAWLVNTWNNLVAWGLDMLQKSKEIAQSCIEAIVTFFTELPEKIRAWLVNVWNNLVTWGLDMLQKSREIAQSCIEAIVTFFSELPGKIWTWLVNTWNNLVIWASNMLNTARTAAYNVINAVVNYFRQLPGKIWTWLTNVVSKVVQWGSNLLTAGKNAALKLVNAVIDGVTSLPAKMIQVGVNIVKGLWQGIQNMIGWFKEQISSFFSGIVDGAKSALGIHSPSTKFKWIGQMCIEGYEEPFDGYDPYGVLKTQANADIGNIRANWEGYMDGYMDYDKMADAQVEAFERAGFEFRADGRSLGRFMRGVVMT